MAKLTWKQVKELFKGNGGAFKKIDWARPFDKIAEVLMVKKDEFLMTALYKLRSKYNNLKELSSADRTKDDNLVVLSTS